MHATAKRRIESRQPETRVTIGGATVAMTSREPDLRLELRGPHTRFVDIARTPDITVQVTWESLPYATPAQKLFDSGGVWQLYEDGHLLAFHLTSPKFGTSPYARATFTSDFASGVVYIRRDCVDSSRPLYPLEYPLDELLITNWLALGSGVEVHACAVVDRDGSGYLLAGYSGAGKTTMARLWCEEQGVSVLSDDRVILRKIGDQFWMFGTPWHGDEPLASPMKAALRGVFLLRHASENQATPVAGASAVTQVFTRTFPPFFSASAIQFTLDFLSDMTSSVPVFDLGFVPSPAIPDFVRHSL